MNLLQKIRSNCGQNPADLRGKGLVCNSLWFLPGPAPDFPSGFVYESQGFIFIHFRLYNCVRTLE